MTDFTDALMSRARLVGITNGADLAARTKIPRMTVYRHLADGNWSRNQLIALHRVIGLDEEVITAYLGRGIKRGSTRGNSQSQGDKTSNT